MSTTGRTAGPSAPAPAAERPFWLARWHRTIFFVPIALTIAGIYAFFKTPISVFPETNFPARRHRRRQRRHARRADAGHHHQAHRRRGQQRPRPRRPCAPPPAAARPRSASSSTGPWTCSTPCSSSTPRSAGAAELPVHRQDHHQPPHLRDLSHPRLQPHLRPPLADANSGSWRPTA